MEKHSKTLNIIMYSWLILLALYILFPLVYTVGSSFKTNSEIMAHPENILPAKPTLENYILAWNSDSFQIKTMLFNSITYTLASVCITLFMSALCGYVFARGNFPGKNIVFGVFAAFMFIGMGSITMYPYFEILNKIGIERSLYSLLFIQMFGMPTYNVFLVRGFVNSIPKEMDEAATIDGCGFIRIFISIILPMLTPILATIAILCFQGSWNSYLMPMIFTMGKPEQSTLIVGVVGLKSSDQAASAWNLMLAGSTIALIPVIIAYAFGSKYFVQGIAAGAVKG